VISVKRIAPPPKKGEAVYPCHAAIGDEIELQVMNLDLWIEGVLAQRGMTSEKKGEALIASAMPNLCLVMDGQAMLTLKVSSWLHTDWSQDEAKAQDELRKLEQKKREDLQREFVGKESADEAKAKWAEFDAWSAVSDKKINRGRVIPYYDYLRFVLTRNETDSQSKNEWNRPLRREGLTPRMDLSIGWPLEKGDTIDGMPSLVGQNFTEVQREFRLKRIPGNGWVVAGLLVIGLALAICLYMAGTTTLVRDPEGPVRLDGLPPYSLGRCQMAFWFFLVAGAFFFLWLVTGRGDLDTINGSTLTMVGISAGTALGAAFIESKSAHTDESASSAAPEQIAYPERIRTAKAKLEAIRAELRAVPASEAARTNELQSQQRATKQEVRELEQELRTYRSIHRNEFLFDLLKERGVVSFHRFQIVVWTLVLGIVFASQVITKLAMPAFDQTLLLLMGISSGTYLGFKLPTANKP
jgi:hypothetical protein